MRAEDFYAYAVIEADAELSPVASEPDDNTVEELVSIYREIAGEHENWDEYRNAMVSERRVIARAASSDACLRDDYRQRTRGHLTARVEWRARSST